MRWCPQTILAEMLLHGKYNFDSLNTVSPCPAPPDSWPLAPPGRMLQAHNTGGVLQAPHTGPLEAYTRGSSVISPPPPVSLVCSRCPARPSLEA